MIRTDSIKLVLYEDDEKDRIDLSELFSSKEEIEFLGAYFNCDSVIRDIESSKPDIVIMDVEMPGTDGVQGLVTIKTYFPEIDVIMLTAFEKDEYIFNCIKSGASGYIIKGTPYPKLIEHIKTVYNGGTEFSPSIANRIRDFIINGFPQNKNRINLTEKQEEALTLLCDGLSQKMIAHKMGISVNGIARHMKSIFLKLQVHSAPAAVAKAIRLRLLKRDKLKFE